MKITSSQSKPSQDVPSARVTRSKSLKMQGFKFFMQDQHGAQVPLPNRADSAATKSHSGPNRSARKRAQSTFAGSNINKKTSVAKKPSSERSQVDQLSRSRSRPRDRSDKTLRTASSRGDRTRSADTNVLDSSARLDVTYDSSILSANRPTRGSDSRQRGTSDDPVSPKRDCVENKFGKKLAMHLTQEELDDIDRNGSIAYPYLAGHVRNSWDVLKRRLNVAVTPTASRDESSTTPSKRKRPSECKSSDDEGDEKPPQPHTEYVVEEPNDTRDSRVTTSGAQAQSQSRQQQHTPTAFVLPPFMPMFPPFRQSFYPDFFGGNNNNNSSNNTANRKTWNR